MEIRIIRALKTQRTSICHDRSECNSVEGEHLLSFDKVTIEGKEYYASMTYPGMSIEANDYGTIFIHDLFYHIQANPSILEQWKGKNHEDIYQLVKELHLKLCKEQSHSPGASHFEYALADNNEVIEQLGILEKFDEWS